MKVLTAADVLRIQREANAHAKAYTDRFVSSPEGRALAKKHPELFDRKEDRALLRGEAQHRRNVAMIKKQNRRLAKRGESFYVPHKKKSHGAKLRAGFDKLLKKIGI